MIKWIGDTPLELPNAKRMKLDTVYLIVTEGFGGHTTKTKLDVDDDGYFEFMLEDDVEHLRLTMMDGSSFIVEATYTNHTKSRIVRKCVACRPSKQWTREELQEIHDAYKDTWEKLALDQEDRPW